MYVVCFMSIACVLHLNLRGETIFVKELQPFLDTHAGDAIACTQHCSDKLLHFLSLLNDAASKSNFVQLSNTWTRHDSSQLNSQVYGVSGIEHANAVQERAKSASTLNCSRYMNSKGKICISVAKEDTSQEEGATVWNHHYTPTGVHSISNCTNGDRSEQRLLKHS